MFLLPLITQEQFKVHAPVQTNVDKSIPNKSIRVAQDKYLQVIFDTEFYVDFQKKYAAAVDQSETITVVDQSNKKFTIAGDFTAYLLESVEVSVSGSTGNDGAYTVQSSALNAGNTEITVYQPIPDATADGEFKFLQMEGTCYIVLYQQHVVPFLSWAALFEGFPHFVNKITNKGIELKSSEYSKVSDRGNVSITKGNIRNTMDHYQRLLIEYLEDNKNECSFTLYKSCRKHVKKRTNFGFILDEPSHDHDDYPHDHDHDHYHKY